MVLKSFSRASTDSIQKITYLAFFLAFFIFFSSFFWISSSERTENTSRTESVPQSQSKQIQRYAKPWLALTVNTQCLYQAPLQLSRRAPPLLTWQAKNLPIRSVPRVTTRSLPSRMMDPTLLHLMMRYRERGTNLGLKHQMIFSSKLKKPADKGSQGEGKMNLQVLAEQLARMIKGQTSICMSYKLITQYFVAFQLKIITGSPSGRMTLLANHSHLKRQMIFLCYRGRRAQSKKAEIVRTKTLKQGIEG